MKILLDPNAAGGGGTPPPAPVPPAPGAPTLNDFVKSLPADLQAEKSLHNMDSPATLAKSYVHAQRLIGAKRLEVPQPTWNEGQWNEFFEAAGRPKTADEYKLPDYKFESDPNFKVPEDKVKPVMQELHKAGLTQKQVDAVMTTYMKSLDTDVKTMKQTAEQKRLEGEATLKNEWGDKYGVNLDLAKSVVTKFGDEALMSYINEGGGNDPRLIKTLARLGAAMMEDKSRGGNAADGLQITDATRATQEISRLKLDKDFMAAMTDKGHPSHKTAVQQWMNLHKIASPGKQKEE